MLILTTFEDDDYVFGALSAGASGFLLERTEPQRDRPDAQSALRPLDDLDPASQMTRDGPSPQPLVPVRLSRSPGGARSGSGRRARSPRRCAAARSASVPASASRRGGWSASR